MANRFVIIVAGGSGLRMGMKVPKQFIILGNQPLLMHTILSFHDIGITNIILVIPIPYITYWKELCNKYSFDISHTIVGGGLFRSESVQNGLAEISDEDAIVGVHDGVRPFASQETILQAYELAEREGTAVPYLDLSDSLRKMEGNSYKNVERDRYKTVQTPQCFRLWMLKKAYQKKQLPSFTDDAALVELLDIPINLFKGNQENIKITTPLDLLFAEAIIKKSK